MTQEFLQDAVVADLEQLFKGETLKNSAGVERRIQVFPQDLPIRAGADLEPELDPEEDPDLEPEQPPEDVPEPYVIVRIPGGELPNQDTRQQVELVLVICVYDPDPNRQGFRDALHIVNTIQWVVPEEDTHPYYFAGMALKLAAPAIFKEVPET